MKKGFTLIELSIIIAIIFILGVIICNSISNARCKTENTCDNNKQLER